MSFVNYPHLILLSTGQTFEVTVTREKFGKGLCQLPSGMNHVLNRSDRASVSANDRYPH